MIEFEAYPLDAVIAALICVCRVEEHEENVARLLILLRAAFPRPPPRDEAFKLLPVESRPDRSTVADSVLALMELRVPSSPTRLNTFTGSNVYAPAPVEVKL